jgi:hypothetical protein
MCLTLANATAIIDHHPSQRPPGRAYTRTFHHASQHSPGDLFRPVLEWEAVLTRADRRPGFLTRSQRGRADLGSRPRAAQPAIGTPGAVAVVDEIRLNRAFAALARMVAG